MELSLVPMEGERVVSETERARAERRVKRIPPEKLARYDDEDRREIKEFLSVLIILSERFHYEMERADDLIENDLHAKRVEKLQSERHALFEDPSPVIAEFIELMQFFAMEPWPEFDMMIAGIRGEDLQRYYEAKLRADAASDVTTGDTQFLTAEGEVDRAQDEQIEAANKCRITPSEIEEMVQSHTLETLVKNLIAGRRLMNGEFWELSHYDL